MTTQVYHTLIHVEELATLYRDSNIVILDCRYLLTDTDKGRKYFLIGHIPGAVFMDIGHDLSSPVVKGITGRHPLPHPEVLASSLRAAGMTAESQVIVYDQSHSTYAARAWWLLNWLGHKRVAILNGGFGAWTSTNLPVDNQWPPPKRGDFTFQLNPDLTIEIAQVASGKDKLIDSREYKRYTGESEPIDPVAGHIPGAQCIPYMDNTDEQGYWKSAQFLSKKFDSIINNGVDSPVFYCGSGVTACQNIFAYKLATGKDARLYPGSWSEWINYHPPATGS